MKKVYISADLEGLNGVVYDHQTVRSGGQSYDNSVEQLHKELNTVIKTLIDSGVERITLNDAHTAMDNIMISRIPDNVELISGKPRPLSMINGLDSSYDCVFFVGYHAKAGAQAGVLAHTFSHVFKKIELNGIIAGEALLNSIYAGRKDVPIAFASGDDVFCEEIISQIGNIQRVCTKKTLSFNSAKCRINEELMKDYEDKVKEAISTPENWKLIKIEPPYSLKILFKDKKHANLCDLLPSVKRISESEVEFNSDDYEAVYKLIQFFSAVFVS